MLIRLPTYRLVIAALGLSLALGLVSFCPAGSSPSGHENAPCTEAHGDADEAHGEAQGICAHALLSVHERDLCATVGVARCVGEALTPFQPNPRLEGSAGLASTLEIALRSYVPTVSSLPLGRSKRAPALFIARHLLHGIWLN